MNTSITIGTRVRVITNGVKHHGKIGIVSQLAPSGSFYGVETRNAKHIGYFHESDLQVISKPVSR